MKKYLLLLVLLLLMVANAEKVKIDGLYYNLDDANKTAEVTYYIYSYNEETYTGNVTQRVNTAGMDRCVCVCYREFMSS